MFTYAFHIVVLDFSSCDLLFEFCLAHLLVVACHGTIKIMQTQLANKVHVLTNIKSQKNTVDNIINNIKLGSSRKFSHVIGQKYSII